VAAAPGRRRGGRVLLAAGVLLVVFAGALLLPRTAAQSDVGPVVAADAPLVTFLRDSWTRGAGATDLRGYAVRAAAELGWRSRLLGVGGSGYSVPGPHDSTFGDRVGDAAAQVGLRFVDVAAEEWTDPDDPRVWSDTIHPDDRGHQLIADRLAPVLRAALTG
jgi:hypothetical protein